MGAQAKHLYEFGPFHLDADERVLKRGDRPVSLTPKAFDTLLALVERSGHIVEKDELMQLVWPDSFVEESNLAFNISVLRRTLVEAGGDPQFIETVPKRGYRFRADVREVREEPTEIVVEKQTLSRVVIEEVKEEQETEKNKETVALAGAISSTADSSHRTVLEQIIKKRRLLAVVVVVIAVTAAIYFWPSSAARQKTVAVLPFRPLSVEAGDRYLELGMADALITKLSNINQLVVRPTSAILKYADSSQDAIAVGHELGVESVLDGSIQRAGDRVRVTVRLLRVSDGASLWAGTFDESFTNIFAVQDSISERLADALALKMTGEERRLLRKRHTENTEAYQAYLKGRYYWSKWNRAGLEKAIEHFEQAIANDSRYALAYSGLADAYNLLGYLNILPPKETFPKSEEMARAALAMDDTLGEAHLSLAKVKIFYDWDWPGFETEIKRALELNPNYPDAHGMYGTYLCAIGRFDESIRERRRALELDPLSPFHTNAVGWSYFYARRYDEAIAWYRQALELDPTFAISHNDLSVVYQMKGMHAESVEETLRARSIAGAKPENINALRQAYATNGIKGFWQKELDMLTERLAHGPVDPHRGARIYHELGDKDRAFEWFEKALEARHSLMVFLKVNPLFDGLHSDPRFASLVERVGFKP